MSEYIYKRDSQRTLEAFRYAIRYKKSEYPKGYAKVKGNKEFFTDFCENNTGFDVYLNGDEITREVYEAF